MAHLFNRNALAVILQELVPAKAISFYEAKISRLQSVRDQLTETGAAELDYGNENFNIIPVLENRLVGLMNPQDESKIHIQLHAPAEPVLVSGDLFFLDHFFASLFSVLVKQQDERTTSIHVIEGNEKCIIEIEQSNASTRITENGFADYLDTLFPVWQKIIEDNGGELRYLHRQQHVPYIRIKLLLA